MEQNNDKLTTYVEVTASVTMSKSLCIEVPEGATKEEVLELAKKEFIIPITGIQYLEGILAQVGVRVQDINDIKNWDIDELEYVTDYEPERLSDNNGPNGETMRGSEQANSDIQLPDGVGMS